MTTTIKQIVEDVIDEMERKTTISYPKQYRKIIVFKLTTKIGAFVRERNGEAARKAAQEILDSVKETPCAKCGAVQLKEEASHECNKDVCLLVMPPKYKCSICGEQQN